ncbi:hypothetical protein C8R43DRAFT_1003072 [Mycena crocata]|nr:hypothetical protein C8R43DRAFT_1003072 [Mycena crocata]
MPNIPPEVWMRMATFIKDDETLFNLGLVSHGFNAIANEEFTRSQYWKTAEEVEPRLAARVDDPRRHRVEELDITLLRFDHNFLLQRRIFASLDIFPNLSSLTIRHGRITSHMHTVVTHLPNLRRLRLQSCAIYVVDRSTAPPATPFTVRNLLLHNVKFMESTANHGVDIDDLDPAVLKARNLSLMPLGLLSGLESLTLSSSRAASSVVRQAYGFLPSTPNLVHLSAMSPPSPYEHDGNDPVPLRANPETVVAVPALTTFRGAYAVALEILPSAVHLAEVVLTDELHTQQAVAIIKLLPPASIRTVELTVTQWDSEVLYEIAHRFLACRRIRIVHRYQAPSDDFLRDVGVHYLSRIPALDTLVIHARPDDAVHKPPTYRSHHFFEAQQQWEADGKAGLRDVPPPPSIEEMRELLAVWRRYNPLLEVVGLGDRLWTRKLRGTEWEWRDDGPSVAGPA